MFSEMKGIIPQGKPCTLRLQRNVAAELRVLNPSFPHSLDHVRVSTVAISLRSSIKEHQDTQATAILDICIAVLQTF